MIYVYSIVIYVTRWSDKTTLCLKHFHLCAKTANLRHTIRLYLAYKVKKHISRHCNIQIMFSIICIYWNINNSLSLCIALPSNGILSVGSLYSQNHASCTLEFHNFLVQQNQTTIKGTYEYTNTIFTHIWPRNKRVKKIAFCSAMSYLSETYAFVRDTHTLPLLPNNNEQKANMKGYASIWPWPLCYGLWHERFARRSRKRKSDTHRHLCAETPACTIVDSCPIAFTANRLARIVLFCAFIPQRVQRQMACL